MSQTYYTTVGLEIHAELKTNSKMFCGCPNNPDETEPNQNICPVCTAQPGSLPVINAEAVKQVVRVGMAIGGQIAGFTEFDRKNYFYPDIPKAYQISQYKYPLVAGGNLLGVDVTRIHLEEDTAVSKHDRGDYSLVDFNRAGVPLMELVTEPVIHDPETAGNFARELQLILRTLGVSDANMEKGQMRVEPNISISTDPKVFGTKVEVKNLNSFRSVERAIAYEVQRMIQLHEAGRVNEIVQETRGWNEAKQETFSQRSKESAHDYRYFPDPDLPKLQLDEAFDLETMRKELPELPSTKRIRFAEVYGLKDEDIESYVVDQKLGSYFESVAIHFQGDKQKAKIASNYITSDIVGLMKKDASFVLPQSEHLAEIVELLSRNLISSRAGKDLLVLLQTEARSPKVIAEERGLLQKENKEELRAIAEKVIAANEKIVADFRAGKQQALMSLVGAIMKETNGSANPKVAKELLEELLG